MDSNKLSLTEIGIQAARAYGFEHLNAQMCSFHFDEAVKIGIEAALAQQAQPLMYASFDETWAASGRQYGEDALEQVRLGWKMARDRTAQQAQPPVTYSEAAFEEAYRHTFSADAMQAGDNNEMRFFKSDLRAIYRAAIAALTAGETK